jgi:hypothetical protein
MHFLAKEAVTVLLPWQSSVQRNETFIHEQLRRFIMRG